MNITKTMIAALMAAMLLVGTTSCDKDKTDDNLNPDPKPAPEPDPEEEDPIINPIDPLSSYVAQNVEAISKAQIAGHVKVNGDYYDMMQYVWSDKFNDFAGKVRKFSNDAAVAIGANSQDNIAVSPLSIFMALSMAAESANGDTRQEILDAMGITYDELAANIRYVCYTCNQVLDRGASNSNGQNQIKSVNSLWVKNGVPVKEEGVNALTTKYFTDLFNMDYDNSDVNQIIKSYISNETKGLLSPELELTPETLLVLMNVVYLRDIWNEYGGELDLSEQKYDFVNYNKSKKSSNLLVGHYHSGRALETEKFRKFYTTTNSGISLTFFVPKDGYTLDDIYTTEVLNNSTSYIYTDEVSNEKVNYRFYTRCFFPEFKANYDGYIQDVIKNMGIKKLFTRFECDFSNLTEEGVYCNKIRHVAQLEVNRKGLEGAAVTVMEMAGNAAPGPEEKVWEDVYEDFIVDRNFAYILSKDGLPIFTGVVKTIE